MASLLGFSLEAMTIDDEMITNICRILRGIHVADDTLSLNVIDDVARVLVISSAMQTLAMMESEYVYPELADRDSPDDWQEKAVRISGNAPARVFLIYSTRPILIISRMKMIMPCGRVSHPSAVIFCRSRQQCRKG